MEPSFRALLDRLDRLSDQFRELREGVQKAIRIADEDPEMALTRARKVLEHVIRDVYQRRCNEPPGSRPLENLIQRLVKDGYFPDRLDAYATTVRKLGNVGTHTFGETITAADVYQSLTQLTPILEWYFEVERPEAADGQSGQEPPRPMKERPLTAPPESRVAVVPKGLRSFDANDADFFLDLLPGPRDRNGLPESIRFWKHGIEEKEEPTFTVGVIYGPSGCGKSSLVKAGLLPKLPDRIVSVYVEATADDTEARLLAGLRRRCPDLPGDLDLTGAIAAVRQGAGPARGRKVLIVLDQFEQWLHARRGVDNPELARALRQCDGERVQCVVLVRDDFWLALTRFMNDLRIELVQGRNAALADLFDPPHARTVLAAFGRAFGRLPDEPTKEQAVFLDQAVAGLAQDGRVISVRLALFAEMVKSKPWTPATLKAVGGTEGVGVTFLEETFSSPVAGPRNRQHQNAARAVLKSLLPERGSDIKGNMRSYEELLEASGYARRPRDFEELVRILDGEVRLITPTQPPEKDAEAEPPSPAVGKYYQLTHDYLVPSLREWLTRKQRETMRGRAELRLAERSAAWNAKPENRYLPAWWEWLNVRLLTRPRDWTPQQRKMMRRAARHHGTQGAVLAVLLTAGLVAGLAVWNQVIEQKKEERADGLVHGLLGADIDKAPNIIGDMKDYRRWADPLLRDAYADAKEKNDDSRQLRASLGLLPADPGQVDYLYNRLLDADPQEVGVIVKQLDDHKGKLIERLWSVVERPEKGHEGRRLRAAAALATYEPDGQRWDHAAGPVVDQLIEVNPVFLAAWMEGLRPVREKLLGPLSAVFRDRAEERAAERQLATSVLADYAADRPELLADLLLDADEKQFAVLFPKVEANPAPAAALSVETVNRPLDPEKADADKETFAKRQANAAVALLRLGRPEEVWPLLKHGPDPRARSYLIHRIGPLGADPGPLVRRLEEEQEISIRRALLLSLGELGQDRLPKEEREQLVPKVLQWYRDEPDAGLHGAAEWLLREWERGDDLKKIDREWAENQRLREEKAEQVRKGLAEKRRRGEGRWYVNSQGQTMVVVPGPVEFLMGSPLAEAGREGGPEGKVEQQVRKRIDRSFAVAAQEVTVGQFKQCPRFKDYEYNKQHSPTMDCPVNLVTWYEASEYCNWLTEQELPRNQWKDQRCYLPNANGEYADGMKLAPDYLTRTGYRLPTEAEWEYACRAGAVTSRYYGESDELLEKYAWDFKNSRDRGMLPGAPGVLGVSAGCLKPNDLGLFDMLGNALEWCQERYAQPYHAGDDVEDDVKEIEDAQARALRGGSFGGFATGVRSADRVRFRPSFRRDVVGFRLARTFR